MITMYYIDLETFRKERYDMKKFLPTVSSCFDILDSYFIKKLLKLNTYGIFAVSGQEGRPDLISYMIYGDTQYWWIIIIFNGLGAAEDIVEGMSLEYPSIDALEDLYFTLSSRQRVS